MLIQEKWYVFLFVSIYRSVCVCVCVCVCMLLLLGSCYSLAWLCATSWTVARQAPLSVGFSRQEFWSGVPCPPLGDLPNPRTEPGSLALTGRFFTTCRFFTTTRESPCVYIDTYIYNYQYLFTLTEKVLVLNIPPL